MVPNKIFVQQNKLDEVQNFSHILGLNVLHWFDNFLCRNFEYVLNLLSNGYSLVPASDFKSPNGSHPIRMTFSATRGI